MVFFKTIYGIWKNELHSNANTEGCVIKHVTVLSNVHGALGSHN